MTDRGNGRRRLGVWRILGSLALAVVTLIVGWRAVTDYVDFPIYYRVGEQILAGRYELYPAGVYASGQDVEGHGYRYAPGIALLFVPLAVVPYHAAAALFFGLKVLAFAHALMILANRLELQGARLALTWAVLAVAGGYLVEEFRGGNVQFLIVYLLVLGFDQAERGKLVRAAVSLGIAVSTKLVPALVAAYILLQRRVSIVIGAMAVVALVAMLPVVLWGYSHNAHLLNGFLNYSATAVESAANDRNYSIRGLLNSVRPFGISSKGVTLMWLGLVFGVVGVMAATFRAGTKQRQIRNVEFAMVLAVLPLLSPHAQRIYFSYLAVPAAVLFGLLRSAELSSRVRAAVMCGLVSAAALGTVLPAVLGSRRLALAYMDFFPYTLAAAILVAVLAVVHVDLKKQFRESTKLSRGTRVTTR